jgi:hypothetical protein
MATIVSSDPFNRDSSLEAIDVQVLTPEQLSVLPRDEWMKRRTKLCIQAGPRMRLQRLLAQFTRNSRCNDFHLLHRQLSQSKYSGEPPVDLISEGETGEQ